MGDTHILPEAILFIYLFLHVTLFKSGVRNPLRTYKQTSASVSL